MAFAEYPKFASENEEAEWLYEHRDEIEDQFLQSIRDGNVRRFVLSPEQMQDLVAVEVSREDFAKAERLAQAAGVEKTSFIRKIFHEALEQRHVG